MPLPSIFKRPLVGTVLLRLVWPTTILFLLTLAFVLGMVFAIRNGTRHEQVPSIVLFGSIVSSVLLILLVFSIRRLTRELAHSQERAQTFFGRDPLSKLPNRLLFTDRLDAELSRLGRMDGGVAVLFLDLDRFKDVNDTYGHQAGDELIKQVAERLSDLLRGADTLARFGGDEFAIIQTGIRSSQDAEALARRILDAVSMPFKIGDSHVTIGVSIGLALAPENGSTHEVLMRLADTALYQAKNEGRNRFSFFERTMDEAIRMRKIVEDDLPHPDRLVHRALEGRSGSALRSWPGTVRYRRAASGLRGWRRSPARGRCRSRRRSRPRSRRRGSAAERFEMRRARASASWEGRMPVWMMANSSPPKRARVSAPRTGRSAAGRPA